MYMNIHTVRINSELIGKHRTLINRWYTLQINGHGHNLTKRNGTDPTESVMKIDYAAYYFSFFLSMPQSKL